MVDKRYKLYSLDDKTGIRYIGITKQRLSVRLSGHISSTKQAFKTGKNKHYRHCWLQSLLAKDEKPVINLICEFDSAKEAQEAEIKAIKFYKAVGVKLTNTTDGGDGVRNYKFSQEHLKKVRHRVDQYNKSGKLIATFNSISEAAELVTGDIKNNSKISSVTKGKRKTAYGYVWRLHKEDFNKYPVKPQWNVTKEQKEALSKRQLENNIMKGKIGISNPGSKPIIVTKDNVIVTILESVKEAIKYSGVSKSFMNKVLKRGLQLKGCNFYYANKDIVQSLQKCKSSTLKTFVGQQYKA